jgi:hypothetical protein
LFGLGSAVHLIFRLASSVSLRGEPMCESLLQVQGDVTGPDARGQLVRCRGHVVTARSAAS